MIDSNSSLNKLLSNFQNVKVLINFRDLQLIKVESLDKIYNGELDHTTEEDYYWQYEIIFNGFKSPRKYSNYLHALKFQFTKELFEHLSKLIGKERSDYLHFLHETFVGNKNQITIVNDLSDYYKNYYYKLEKNDPSTSVRLIRILDHSNIHYSKKNATIVVEGKEIIKDTDDKWNHEISLFLEEQLSHINLILEYLNRYILGEITEDYIKKDTAKIDDLNPDAKRKPKYPDSFQLSDKSKPYQCITDLCNSLKENNFISKINSIKDFRRLFFGDKIINQIIWTGSPSELRYFIEQLMEEGKVITFKRGKWIVAQKCFINPDKSPLKNNDIAQSKNPTNRRQTLLNDAISFL